MEAAPQVALEYNASEKPRSVAMRNGFSRIDAAADHLEFTGMVGRKGRYPPLTAYQVELSISAVDCALLPSDISPLTSTFGTSSRNASVSLPPTL